MKDYTLKTVRHLTKAQRTNLALYLRFRTLNPRLNQPTYATLKQIAELLRCSIPWVHKACCERKEAVEAYHTKTRPKRGNRPQPPVHYKWKRYKYTKEHRDWLTSFDELSEQAHLCLAERCALYHRRFPDMRLSVGKIREIYREHKVKRKFLREVKYVTPAHWLRINSLAKEAYQQMSDYVRRGFSIIYLDEVCFTKTTLPKLCWSPLCQPL